MAACLSDDSSMRARVHRVRVSPGTPDPAAAIAAVVQQGDGSQQLPHEAGAGQYAGADADAESFLPTVALLSIKDRQGYWHSSAPDFGDFTVSLSCPPPCARLTTYCTSSTSPAAQEQHHALQCQTSSASISPSGLNPVGF